MGLFDNILKEAGKAVDNKIGNGSNEFSNAINTATEKKDEAIYGSSESNNKTIETVNEGNQNRLIQGTVYDYNLGHSSAYGNGFTNEKIKEDGDSPICEYRIHEGSTGIDTPDTKLILSFDIPKNFMDFDSETDIDECFMYTPVNEITDDNYNDVYDEYFDTKNPIICIYSSMNAIYNGVKGYVENGVPNDNNDSKEYISTWEDVKGKCGNMLFKAKVENYYDKVIYFYGFIRRDDSSNSEFEYGLTLEYSKDIIDTPLEVKLHKIFDHVAQSYKEEIKPKDYSLKI